MHNSPDSRGATGRKGAALLECANDGHYLARDDAGELAAEERWRSRWWWWWWKREPVSVSLGRSQAQAQALIAGQRSGSDLSVLIPAHQVIRLAALP